MKKKLINTTDASKCLGISMSTLYSYTSKEKIPHIKLAGKVLFDEKDLNSWLESKKKVEIKLNNNNEKNIPPIKTDGK
jgi:excisionase family DNA binding protein